MVFSFGVSVREATYKSRYSQLNLHRTCPIGNFSRQTHSLGELNFFCTHGKKYRNIVSVGGKSKLDISCDCHCSIFADQILAHVLDHGT